MSPGLDERSRRWVEEVTGGRVTGSEPLCGGLSSDVTAVTVSISSRHREFVMRRHRDVAWMAAEPDLVRREAQALAIALAGGLPVPRCIGMDPRGDSTGMPALLMTRLAGSPLIGEHDVEETCGRLAELAERVHDVEVASADLRAYAPWGDPHEIPAWTGDRGAWLDASDVLTGRRAAWSGRSVLLHRDFHPLNVLFEGGKVSGLVDWADACHGPQHAELGHCRWNLAVLAGQDVADRFLDVYLERTGTGPYDPWWDLTTAFDVQDPAVAAWRDAGRRDITDQRVMHATDRFVEAALRRL